MSTAQGWDLTVPEDDAELLAELRRHGVVAGKRWHLVPGDEQEQSAPDALAPRRRFIEFIGSISAEPDLASNADKYLAEGFGRD